MSRTKLLAIGTALIMAAAACGSPEVSGADLFYLDDLPEPTSTADLSDAGGGSVQPLKLEALPSRATAAVEVTILDVKRSRANTSDGSFPDIDIDQGPEQLRGLYPLTDIDVRIEAVLGARGELAEALAPGQVVAITVHGGQLHTILLPEEAKALGVLVTPNETPPDPNADAEGADRKPSAEVEVEVFPDEPTPFSIGVAPDERLAEGERVLLFLARADKPAFSGASPISVLAVAHPVGVFHLASDGIWVSDLAPDRSIDALDLARAVSRTP